MTSNAINRGRCFAERNSQGWLAVVFAIAMFFGGAMFFSGFTRGEGDTKESPGPPGWLGLAIDDSLVPGRLVVVEVDAGGPAAKAGVGLQDMVLAIDGEPTIDAERFAAAIATISAGDNVRFSIARGGSVEEFTLVAAEAPLPNSSRAKAGDSKPLSADEIAPPAQSAFAQPPSVQLPSVQPPSAFPSPVESTPPKAPDATVPAISEQRPASDPWQRSNGTGVVAEVDGVAAGGRAAPLGRETGSREMGAREMGRSKTALGVRTVPVDPVVQARFSLPEPTGALVVGLVDDLPASRAGLPTGSVIVAFDRQPVRSPTELTRLVSESPIDRPVKLEYILPGGESRATEISLVSVTAKADAFATNSSSTADPDRDALRLEILQMRKAIEAIAGRLEELERRLENRSR